VHDGWRFNTTFFVASTAGHPRRLLTDTAGFVPKMQPTPVKVSSLCPAAPPTARACSPATRSSSIDALALHSVSTLLAYMQDRKGAPAVLEVLRKASPSF